MPRPDAEKPLIAVALPASKLFHMGVLGCVRHPNDCRFLFSVLRFNIYDL